VAVLVKGLPLDVHGFKAPIFIQYNLDSGNGVAPPGLGQKIDEFQHGPAIEFHHDYKILKGHDLIGIACTHGSSRDDGSQSSLIEHHKVELQTGPSLKQGSRFLKYDIRDQIPQGGISCPILQQERL